MKRLVYFSLIVSIFYFFSCSQDSSYLNSQQSDLVKNLSRPVNNSSLFVLGDKVGEIKNGKLIITADKQALLSWFEKLAVNQGVSVKYESLMISESSPEITDKSELYALFAFSSNDYIVGAVSLNLDSGILSLSKGTITCSSTCSVGCTPKKFYIGDGVWEWGCTYCSSGCSKTSSLTLD